MNTPSLTPASPAGSQEVVPAVIPASRLMYWSVRRELWENRSLYVAPLIVEAVVLFGFLISTIQMPQRMRALAALDPARQREAVTMPYNVAAGLVILTAFVVGFFYCVDALHGERRDRSILFWKSLPVSDRISVLSKAGIPLVVLPLFLFAIIITTHLIMLMLSTLVLMGNGRGLTTLYTHVTLFQTSFALLYALIAIALWHAPVYAWLLLVSAWARRAPILWAVLPPLAICMFEATAFRTSQFASFLGYRLVGWFEEAFVIVPKGTKVAIEPLAALTPGKFLSTPGLWIGLLFAAMFIAATVRLRRDREPI